MHSLNLRVVVQIHTSFSPVSALEPLSVVAEYFPHFERLYPCLEQFLLQSKCLVQFPLWTGSSTILNSSETSSISTSCWIGALASTSESQQGFSFDRMNLNIFFWFVCDFDFRNIGNKKKIRIFYTSQHWPNLHYCILGNISKEARCNLCKIQSQKDSMTYISDKLYWPLHRKNCNAKKSILNFILMTLDNTFLILLNRITILKHEKWQNNIVQEYYIINIRKFFSQINLNLRI